MANQCPTCHSLNPPASRYCADCGAPLTPTPEPPDSVETKTIKPGLEFETGALFAGRYQIIEKIGTGGMGRVFKAYDTKIRERIAIKLLRTEIAFDEKTIERFRSEIRLARRISHKNICRVFDMGEYEGIHYITMEFVPGESLKNIIRMTAPLSILTAVHYAKEICEGLEEAHRWDVIHRDLKPQNIMVDPTATVRIMDFGIARSVEPTGQTDPGVAVGTPEYMSPEQAEGQTIDPRTDIYAFGVVFYEMVTGKVPFTAETTLGVLRKQEIELPRPPKELNRLVPDRLNRLILKCLEKSKERRYQNAGEILQELRAIPTGSAEVAGAKAGRLPKSSVPPSRAKAYRVMGIAIGIIALAVGGFYAVRHWIPGSGAPKKPVKSPFVPGPNKFIAILPFDLNSPDVKYANLGKDLAESVRTRLSVSGLRILSPYSSEIIHKSQDRPVETQKANVGQYLQGTLRVDGADISVSLNFIDAASESIAWAREYSEKLAEVYSGVPDKISLDLAKQMRAPLGGEQLEELRKHGTRSLEAYLAIVNGREATDRFTNSGQDVDFYEGLRLIRQGIGFDPGYALAYRALGDLYEMKAVHSHQNGDAEEKADLEAMSGAIKKAYELDPSNPGSQAGMGWIYFHQGKFDEAYKAFKTALSYGPDDAAVNRDVGSFLRSIGLDEPALKRYEVALEVDPFAPLNYLLGGVCELNLGRYVQAEEKFKRALALSPDDVETRLWHVRLLTMMGRAEEAGKELDGLEGVKTLSARNLLSVKYRRALVLALRGERAKALSLISGGREPYRPEITNTYSVLSMKTEAIRNIRWGNEHGFELIQDYLYPYPYLINNPLFRNLTDDPGFQSILRNEKARFEAKLKKYGDI